MADLDLRVDYQDDILDSSVNTKRKYNIIENEDGTKSLEDVSVYTQNGDSFGAADINKTNQAVLDLNSSLTLDFTNASPDVQNVNTLLQNLLDKFYPNWDGYSLYKNGDNCNAITGGWIPNTIKASSNINILNSPIFLESCIELTQTGYGSNSTCCSAITINKIDFTKYNKIWVESILASDAGETKCTPSIAFVSSNTNLWNTDYTKIIECIAGVNSYNISDLVGFYYVVVGIVNDRHCYVNRVWLE